MESRSLESKASGLDSRLSTLDSGLQTSASSYHFFQNCFQHVQTVLGLVNDDGGARVNHLVRDDAVAAHGQAVHEERARGASHLVGVHDPVASVRRALLDVVGG